MSLEHDLPDDLRAKVHVSISFGDLMSLEPLIKSVGLPSSHVSISFGDLMSLEPIGE